MHPLLPALLAASSLTDVLGNPTDAAQINSRCDAWVAHIEQAETQLATETGPATVPGTLARYDALTAMVGSASGEATLYRETGLDDARRAAGAACEVRISSIANRIGLSRPIYERLKAVSQAGADAPTRLLLTRALGEFERSGVALPEDKRRQAQALADRLAELGTKFDKAIADGRKTITADPAELEGLPADFIAAHKPGPDGKVVLSTDYTDYVPTMTYAKSAALRERFARAYLTRAWPENDANLRALIDTRNELAHLLGRPDHATLALENKMLDTPAKVESLLDEMSQVARPAARRDYARKLAVYQLDHPGARTFNTWDNAYLTNLVQKRDFSYDRQQARQYFAYNQVRDGILRLTERLFSVTIRPWDTPVWAGGVESYEMLDGQKVIGRFYFDSHPRPGKYEHANAVPLRPGIKDAAIPVGALVMNLPAGDHTTGLMEHNDVETFLHEFGHLLHHVFGGQQAKWASQSGVATEWDFVEAPSQMLEEWVYDYDTLSKFAVNARGETIPRDLVDRMNKARHFDLGMTDMRQVALSMISLRLHQGPAPADLGARTREIQAKYDLLPYPDWVQMQDSFPHLNGYSAIYYTYRWSKVIADDLFTRFAKNGLTDPNTASSYRRLVLEPGGSKPAAQLVQDFLGRPVSLAAYKAELARDQ